MSIVELYDPESPPLKKKVFEGAFWIPCSDGRYPDNGIFCDMDIFQSTPQAVLVTRAICFCNILPGKLHRPNKYAFVAIDKQSKEVNAYEVLTGGVEQFAWVPSSNGQLIKNAVYGGRTRGGENLFIGRFSHENTMVPGHINPILKKCTIIWGQNPYAVFESNHYEILVGVPKGEKLPDKGTWAELVANVSGNTKNPSVPHPKYENLFQAPIPRQKMLVESSVIEGPQLGPNCVELYKKGGKPIIAREACWVTVEDRNYPENSIYGDSDINGIVLVARGHLNGHTIPGKYAEKWDCSYITVEKNWYYPTTFEVLTGNKDSFAWIPSSNGKIEDHAVIGGQLQGGESLFIGRFRLPSTSGNEDANFVPGHIQPSQKKCFICWGEKPEDVFESTVYEILVSRAKIHKKVGIPLGERKPENGTKAVLVSNRHDPPSETESDLFWNEDVVKRKKTKLKQKKTRKSVVTK